jgi:hypothetical protein
VAKKRLTKFMPMNPAQPVIKIVFIFGSKIDKESIKNLPVRYRNDNIVQQATVGKGSN